jgi:hypothetical protein
MPVVRAILVVAVLLMVPASAMAAPPWSPARPAEGVAGAYRLLTTAGGGRVLVGVSPERAFDSQTVLATLGEDGAETGRQRLRIAHALATAAGERIVVAGSRPAATTREAERAPVLVASGPAGALGAPRALPGTRGQWVSSLAGRGRTVAMVTATMYYRGRPGRTLWIRRGGQAFRRVLTIRPGPFARDTAVAVGPRGDVLVVWQEQRAIRARHVSRGGRVGPEWTLGHGVQSALQANLAAGRMEVAWMSQRVGEGDAHTPARVAYASAPRGGRFGRPRTVGRSSPTGTGRYVKRPGVRLEPAGGGRSVLAWTDYDGERFRVRTADVTDGAVGTPARLTPPGDDFVLGDLAVSAQGAVLVLSLSGTRGNDPSGAQRVLASVRAAGAPAFGPSELVSDAAADAPPVVFAAAGIDAVGRPLAAFEPLGGASSVAVRAGGP